MRVNSSVFPDGAIVAYGTTRDIDEVINDINMTLRIDLMPVLQISFIITAPVMKTQRTLICRAGSISRKAPSLKPRS